MDDDANNTTNAPPGAANPAHIAANVQHVDAPAVPGRRVTSRSKRVGRPENFSDTVFAMVINAANLRRYADNRNIPTVRARKDAQTLLMDSIAEEVGRRYQYHVSMTQRAHNIGGEPVQGPQRDRPLITIEERDRRDNFRQVMKHRIQSKLAHHHGLATPREVKEAEEEIRTMKLAADAPPAPMGLERWYMAHPDLGWTARLAAKYRALHKRDPSGDTALTERYEFCCYWWRSQETFENKARVQGEHQDYKEEVAREHNELMELIGGVCLGDYMDPSTRLRKLYAYLPVFQRLTNCISKLAGVGAHVFITGNIADQENGEASTRVLTVSNDWSTSVPPWAKWDGDSYNRTCKSLAEYDSHAIQNRINSVPMPTLDELMNPSTTPTPTGPPTAEEGTPDIKSPTSQLTITVPRVHCPAPPSSPVDAGVAKVSSVDNDEDMEVDIPAPQGSLLLSEDPLLAPPPYTPRHMKNALPDTSSLLAPPIVVPQSSIAAHLPLTSSSLTMEPLFGEPSDEDMEDFGDVDPALLPPNPIREKAYDGLPLNTFDTTELSGALAEAVEPSPRSSLAMPTPCLGHASGSKESVQLGIQGDGEVSAVGDEVSILDQGASLHASGPAACAVSVMAQNGLAAYAFIENKAAFVSVTRSQPGVEEHPASSLVRRRSVTPFEYPDCIPSVSTAIPARMKRPANASRRRQASFAVSDDASSDDEVIVEPVRKRRSRAGDSSRSTARRLRDNIPNEDRSDNQRLAISTSAKPQPRKNKTTTMWSHTKALLPVSDAELSAVTVDHFEGTPYAASARRIVAGLPTWGKGLLEVVRLALLFEHSPSTVEGALTIQHYPRPQELGWWKGFHRRLSPGVLKGSFTQFPGNFRLWYGLQQPEERFTDPESGELGPVPPNADWEKLYVCGGNGFCLVVIGLVIWRMYLDEQPSDGNLSDWCDMLLDVKTVLEAMLGDEVNGISKDVPIVKSSKRRSRTASSVSSAVVSIPSSSARQANRLSRKTPISAALVESDGASDTQLGSKRRTRKAASASNSKKAKTLS